MLKVRITYNREDEKELKKAIEKLEKDFDILNKSKIYRGEGKVNTITYIWM